MNMTCESLVMLGLCDMFITETHRNTGNGMGDSEGDGRCALDGRPDGDGGWRVIGEPQDYSDKRSGDGSGWSCEAVL